MKQYIDRNALLEELRNDLNNDINIYCHHFEKEYRDAQYEFAIERIEEASAADVRENIHAKWTYGGYDYNDWVCSNCKHDMWECYYSKPKEKFCSECGAIMDLE